MGFFVDLFLGKWYNDRNMTPSQACAQDPSTTQGDKPSGTGLAAPKDWAAIAQAQKAQWEIKKAELIGCEALDDDGYPTQEALELIASWHFSEPQELFAYIESIWQYRAWGWSEFDAKDLPASDQDHKSESQRMLTISTGGWSGNESIIGALQSNTMIWALHWVQSRRGGHYIFFMER